MDDQLVIDSSGAWVRKTARLIAEKPIPLPEHLGGLPRAADRSFDFTGDQHENIYTVLLDWKHCSPAQAE
jgi:hypothetical protein